MFPDVRQSFPVDVVHVIVYSSTRVGMNDEEVIRLLLESARRNHAFEIAGELWFGETRFFQVLEGEPTRVRQLFANLQRDPRHQDIVVHQDGCSRERRCNGFSTHVFDGDESHAIQRLVTRFSR